jgi:Ca-activated chloride channel family protein
LIPIKSQNGVSQEYKRDRQGKLVTSKLNEMALREIADAGNGIYVRFDNRLTGYRNLIQAIDSMEKKTISTHEFLEFEDRYQIFAIISLLFFIIGFMFPTKKKQKDTWRGRIV